MTTSFIANLKGSQGIQGIQGVQGLPGVNAVANDAATAGYISTAGASATKTALANLLFLSVRSFGAVGDGVTDDTAAFTAAINYANALAGGSTGDAAVTGVTIFCPDGRYVISAALPAILRSGVCIVGSSQEGAVLLLSYNGATFTWGDATHFPIGGGIANVKLEYTGTPGAASTVMYVFWASRLRFENLAIVNVSTIAILGSSSAKGATQIDFVELRGWTYNSGRSVFMPNYGAGLNLTNCRIYVGGVVAPIANRTSTMTTVANTNMVSFGVGTWDTMHITGCMFERYYRGIHAAMPSGTIVNNVHISNSYFDYHKDTCLYLSAATGGIVSGFMISNCWFAAWESNGVDFRGPGLIRGMSVSNSQFVSAGAANLSIGAACQDITVIGNLMYGSNRLNINAMGISVFAGTNLTISGNNVGRDSTWGGFPWQPLYGIYVAPDLDLYTISGNIVAGTSAGLSADANTTGSKNRIISDNVGAAYSGSAPITLPATTVAWTNKDATISEIFIYGGTVTVIAKNGTAVAGMTSGHIMINPGETFAVTYSAAPSVTRFVQA